MDSMICIPRFSSSCISRSFPLPPRRMIASLATVSVAVGPESHAQSRPSGRAIKHHMRTQHAVLASPQSRSARLHSMRVAGNTLEASCCRTCRCRCAKTLVFVGCCRSRVCAPARHDAARRPAPPRRARSRRASSPKIYVRGRPATAHSVPAQRSRAEEADRSPAVD